MRALTAGLLSSVLFLGCKSDTPRTFDAGKTPIAAVFLDTLGAPTSVEAVLLQLGHADGAEVFTVGDDDIKFDSSERGVRATLTPAQITRVQSALFHDKARGPGMPHWVFRANLGFRFRSGSDEVRVVVGLGQYGHYWLSKGGAWQTLILQEEPRQALTALGTEIFGTSVTTDVVAPGRTLEEFFQGKNETY